MATHPNSHSQVDTYHIREMNDVTTLISDGGLRIAVLKDEEHVGWPVGNKDNNHSKTFTPFQIIWSLWKSRAAIRILFLADRNILIDQTIVDDFKPFKGGNGETQCQAKDDRTCQLRGLAFASPLASVRGRQDTFFRCIRSIPRSESNGACHESSWPTDRSVRRIGESVFAASSA